MAAKRASVIAASDVLSLFPTLVWKTELKQEVSEAINSDIRKKLDELTQSIPELRPGQSWQSNQDLHRLQEFRELVSCIGLTTKSVLEFLRIVYGAFEISACWANINARGAEHKIHSHPNNFLSGVYYVRVQDGADTINFHDPRPQTGIIRPPVAQLTSANTDQAVVKISPGTLLLFPAWLPHSVNPNMSDEKRISISFNIMFTSFTEKMSAPLWDGGLRSTED